MFCSFSGKPAFSNYLKFAGVKALLLSAFIAGCGGGGGGGDSTPSSSVASTDHAITESVASPTITASPSLIDTAALAVAQPTAAVAGWSMPVGTLIAGQDSYARWKFQSDKNVWWTPGSIELPTDGKSIFTMRYDFGCQTTLVTLRLQDCRNGVGARNLLARTIPVADGSAISLELRNPQASATFYFRVWDATGQVLQYPVLMRSIENRSPNEYQKVLIALDKPSSYWSGANDGKLRSPIVAISISAEPLNPNDYARGVNYPQGSLDVGEIRLLPTPDQTYKLQKAESVMAATGSFFPSYKGRLAIAANTFDSALLDKAKAAGFFTIRRDLMWDVVEKNRKYNFTGYLDGMSLIEQKGMSMLWILDYGHPDYGGIPKTSTGVQAFSNFAKAAAQTFKGRAVIGYEIWNEPDGEDYWSSPNPDLYANLLESSSAAIRSADASAKVISGGIGISDPTYLYKMIQQKSKLANVTAIGLHPYRLDTKIQTSPTYRRMLSTPESFAADQAIMDNVQTATGVNLPRWNTEWGYTTWGQMDPNVYGTGNDPRALDRQAKLALRSVLTQFALNMPLITVYHLIDRGSDPVSREDNFGLLRQDKTERPVYTAFKQLYQRVGDFTFKGYLPDVPPHLHGLRWDKGSSRIYSFWADSTDFRTSVEVPAGAKVVRWDGSAVALATRPDGTATVTLGEPEGPIYVEIN